MLPTLLCDFYKIAHRQMYPQGLEYLYSTLTPRSNKHAPHLDRVVVFGIQGFIKKYLIDFFNENFFQRPEEEVVKEHREFIAKTLGIDEDPDHIRELHRLGKLPIKIKAIEEGLSVAIKVPVLTIENTHPKFAWLTNYLETLINCSLWQPMVSASIARKLHILLESFAKETGDLNALPFQAHDFSMRGMSSLESAETSGAGHLIYFKGTDTIPAISYIEKYYGSKDLIGTSVAATEHSIMSAHGVDEIPTFRYLMQKFPNSILSIVSDTTDFWKNIDETLVVLKDEIMARPENAKIVIRPDSGEPLEIVCGKEYPSFESEKELYERLNFNQFDQNPNFDYRKPIIYQVKDRYVKVFYDEHPKFGGKPIISDYELTSEEKGLAESLWDLFGGTINDKGYKVLDPHIGIIYGDGMNYEKIKLILEKLKAKGFASTNIVFGVGSFVYQYNTRDTLGFATKATSAIINGEERAIFKNPKTDDGTKKSQRGRVVVPNLDLVIDGLTKEEEQNAENLLKTIFEDGVLIETNFDRVRAAAI